MNDRIRVLLVEDNPGDARLIREMLRGERQFELAWVESLSESVSYLAHHAADAVLLDLGLPDSQGLPTLVALHTRWPDLPIVILTGNDSDSVSMQAVNAGAQDFLAKGAVDTPLLARSVRYACDRKRAKMELQKSEDDLRRANEALRETTAQLMQTAKLTALGQLAAGLTHELNQPLNSIGLICQELVRRPDEYGPEEVQSQLRQVLTLVASMARIVSHTRVFVRSAAQFEFREIDIHATLDETLLFVEHQLRNHKVELRKQYASGLPAIRGDATRLKQVLLNLMVNALAALDGCSRTEKCIVLRTSEHEDPVLRRTIVVEVKDNGMGIPEPLRELIFQPFFTTKDPERGTGLGLSISRKIVEEHRGRIEFDSSPEGTVFRVVLPAHRKGEIVECCQSGQDLGVGSVKIEEDAP